jgi:carboxypeptidase T
VSPSPARRSTALGPILLSILLAASVPATARTPTATTATPTTAARPGGVSTIARADQVIAPSVTTTEFPAGWQGFHTYAEMSAYVKKLADAYPAIVHRFSIGQSYQGRRLWAVKISDNVNVDENEPEVLFDGLHHAREHMSLEMTLQIYNWLVNGYGKDSQVTSLINSREIWIVFAVNPDGAEYDIAGGRYHLWRKNRQPTPKPPYIGTDLNRNYSYHWGCCAGSSTNPANLMYRGPKPFSAPETRAMRDFINSRVVHGRQQIRTAITFHTSGRLVMWPYGYTYANVPPDMTALDQRTFVAFGKSLALRNGYKPEQASDLYISAGTTRDWEYGVHRIFAFTFELTVGWYPDDSAIGPETRRNRSAILFLISKAWCPYSAIASQATHYCGPLFDDFEAYRGWRANPDGTDTATSGRWQRGNPAPTSAAGPKQLDRAGSGRYALVTGAAAGSGAGANDLDGVSTMRSPDFTLSAGHTYRLAFKSTFAHSATSTSSDYWRIRIVANGGANAVLYARHGSATDLDGKWVSRTVSIPSSFVGTTAHLVIEAGDIASGNLFEVAVDDVAVMRVS